MIEKVTFFKKILSFKSLNRVKIKNLLTLQLNNILIFKTIYINTLNKPNKRKFYKKCRFKQSN